MKYSFFGTCYNDTDLIIKCINTICLQTVLPKEVVLVNSGSNKIKSQLEKILLLNSVNIKLIYIEKNLSRNNALNLAIGNTSSKYIFRFDARTRFRKDYAEKALKVFLKNPSYFYIGGVPTPIVDKNTFNASTSAGILSRDYIFGYPRHRKKNYEGPSNSIYLGCFKAAILKSILYRDKISIVSEDSLLSVDFQNAGYQPFISSKLKLAYLCRPSIFSTIRLFNSYGCSRINTILSSLTIHSPSRYMILLLIFSSILFFLFINFQKTIIFSIILIFLYNFLSEMYYSKFKINLIYPILAIICQFAWIIGIFKGLINYRNVKSKKSNFF